MAQVDVTIKIKEIKIKQTEHAVGVAYCHKRKHQVGLRMHYHSSSRCGSQRTLENSTENRKCVSLMFSGIGMRLLFGCVK